MNFYDWWDQLTSKEQMLIGKNNAKFVWDQAMDEAAKSCTWKTGIDHVDAAVEVCHASILNRKS